LTFEQVAELTPRIAAVADAVGRKLSSVAGLTFSI
jgi:hypothetical protein